MLNVITAYKLFFDGASSERIWFPDVLRSAFLSLSRSHLSLYKKQLFGIRRVNPRLREPVYWVMTTCSPALLSH